MGKSLCEMQGLLKKKRAVYVSLVNSPRFLCTKCGRVANKKKYLCQPKKLNSKTGL